MINNLIIAYETNSILKTGTYVAESKSIMLDKDNIQKVVLYPDNQNIQSKSTNKYNTKYYVYERDTTTAVFKCPVPQKCAVLNFASAKNAGGGFLTGVNAQEESLCRSSSLYASIGSDAAKPMYEYNRQHKSIFYSDYMLFSPNVTFFREFNGKLTADFTNVSVITAAAVNCNIADPVKNADKIREIMQRRIRKIFDIAIQNNKTYLILGAWGCGVFKQDAWDIAKDFKTVLAEEKYANAFKTVEFSALCGRHKENLTPFNKCFKASR